MDDRSFKIPDLLIFIPVFLLLVLSILIIYSSDTQLALQQLVFAFIGLAFFYLISTINIDSYSGYSYIFYLLVLLLLVLVFVFGDETRGSTRWISLGFFQIQPSELAKPILILLLSNFWSKCQTSWSNIFLSLIITTPCLVMIFLQPDLGTALVLFFIWLSILIGVNVSFKKILVMLTAALTLTPLGWVLLKDYQKHRILSFLTPSQDPLGTGYNVIQSMIAVGSGQVLGRGIGGGTQSRLKFLPEYRTDFIFASIAEELGFLGSIVVLILYGIIILRFFKLLERVDDRLFIAVIFGVGGMLFFQVIVNIGMNVGILPVTGITLPLLSYGGSSLISTLICLGMVASSGHRSFRRHLPE